MSGFFVERTMREDDPVKKWRPRTMAVRGGTARSHYGETAEALFMTSGYVYDSAEAAEARFQGRDSGFIYSRYANPTVAMFEDRMALMEGAPAINAILSSNMATVGLA